MLRCFYTIFRVIIALLAQELLLHIFLEQIKQYSPCRWRNEHRNMYEVIGDKYMYLIYCVLLVGIKRRTWGKVIVVYIVILNFWVATSKFCTEWQQALPDCKLFWTSSCIHFLFVRVVPKFMNRFTPSTDFSCMLVSTHIQHLIFGEKIRILGNEGEIFNP